MPHGKENMSFSFKALPPKWDVDVTLTSQEKDKIVHYLTTRPEKLSSRELSMVPLRILNKHLAPTHPRAVIQVHLKWLEAQRRAERRNMNFHWQNVVDQWTLALKTRGFLLNDIIGDMDDWRAVNGPFRDTGTVEVRLPPSSEELRKAYHFSFSGSKNEIRDTNSDAGSKKSPEAGSLSLGYRYKRCDVQGDHVLDCPSNADPSYGQKPTNDYQCKICKECGKHFTKLCPKDPSPNSIYKQRLRNRPTPVTPQRPAFQDDGMAPYNKCSGPDNKVPGTSSSSSRQSDSEESPIGLFVMNVGEYIDSAVKEIFGPEHHCNIIKIETYGLTNKAIHFESIEKRDAAFDSLPHDLKYRTKPDFHKPLVVPLRKNGNSSSNYDSYTPTRESRKLELDEADIYRATGNYALKYDLDSPSRSESRHSKLEELRCQRTLAKEVIGLFVMNMGDAPHSETERLFDPRDRAKITRIEYFGTGNRAIHFRTVADRDSALNRLPSRYKAPRAFEDRSTPLIDIFSKANRTRSGFKKDNGKTSSSSISSGDRAEINGRTELFPNRMPSGGDFQSNKTPEPVVNEQGPMKKQEAIIGLFVSNVASQSDESMIDQSILALFGEEESDLILNIWRWGASTRVVEFENVERRDLAFASIADTYKAGDGQEDRAIPLVRLFQPEDESLREKYHSSSQKFKDALKSGKHSEIFIEDSCRLWGEEQALAWLDSVVEEMEQRGSSELPNINGFDAGEIEDTNNPKCNGDSAVEEGNGLPQLPDVDEAEDSNSREASPPSSDKLQALRDEIQRLQEEKNELVIQEVMDTHMTLLATSGSLSGRSRKRALDGDIEGYSNEEHFQKKGRVERSLEVTPSRRSAEDIINEDLGLQTPVISQQRDIFDILQASGTDYVRRRPRRPLARDFFYIYSHSSDGAPSIEDPLDATERKAVMDGVEYADALENQPKVSLAEDVAEDEIRGSTINVGAEGEGDLADSQEQSFSYEEDYSASQTPATPCFYHLKSISSLQVAQSPSVHLNRKPHPWQRSSSAPETNAEIQQRRKTHAEFELWQCRKGLKNFNDLKHMARRMISRKPLQTAYRDSQEKVKNNYKMLAEIRKFFATTRA